MNPSHMHHHRLPSATLSLKFAETKKVKEEEESDMEEEQEEELEFEDEVETEEEEEESGEVEEVKEEEQEEEEEVEETQLKKKRMDLDGGSGSRRPTTTAAGGSGGFGVAPPLICRVEKCNADLADSKKYHKRHRVCEFHAKAQVAMVDGRKQRFCQQCSRFHELPEFDDTKRSCRRRLEGHNARRRKNSMESRAEGSGHRRSRLAPKKDQCRQVEEIGRSQIAFPKNHQNLHIH